MAELPPSLTPTEIKERLNRVNTFTRFNRIQMALNVAYALRLDITTSGLQTDKVWAEMSEQLAELEVTIAQLEQRKLALPGQLLRRALRRFQLMLLGQTEESRQDL
jgi:hypothetical protein